jgi:hypothetical protein
MLRLAISATPNQSLTFSSAGINWRIRIHAALDRTCIDIVRNEQTLAIGLPLVLNEPFPPYPYLQGWGFFVLDGEDGAEVDFREFGTGQNLFFVSPDDLAL